MEQKKSSTHTVQIGQTETGTFVAVSAHSPYFCFEAASEEEVVALAGRALNFFYQTEGNIAAVPHRETPRLSRVVRTKKEKITLQCACA